MSTLSGAKASVAFAAVSVPTPGENTPNPFEVTDKGSNKLRDLPLLAIGGLLNCWALAPSACIHT